LERERPNGTDVDLNQKSILITGGTGSFGRQFVRTVLRRFRPARLVIFSRDELKQSDMAEEISPARFPCVRYFLGDVRDQARLEMAFRGLDIVIHAAALKQIPAAEYNPFECIHTNVLGAENIVRSAIKSNVKQVIALSTDKAVNPINLYGASKLAADKIFVAGNHLSGDAGTRFSVVRYGNVLGSRGSVIPYFQKLIREGATSLPITHEEMTRFWITKQMGVDFVLSTLSIMDRGEIFVPKMPSMGLVKLAKALAPELPHTIIGIRPGEKLHEVLVTPDDASNTYEQEDRFVIMPSIALWSTARLMSGEKVPSGFCYSSNRNPRKLSSEEVLSMLADLESKDNDPHDVLLKG
jgi:UDP-N-acetylglucosamine 4,6-dehydratase/5-epimerase